MGYTRRVQGRANYLFRCMKKPAIKRRKKIYIKSGSIIVVLVMLLIALPHIYFFRGTNGKKIMHGCVATAPVHSQCISNII